MTEVWNNGTFTLDDLKKIMRACAGVAESVDLDSDIGDITFEDLGYDSLAVLETAARVQNEFGVIIPDDEAEKLTTPRSLIEYVCIKQASWKPTNHSSRKLVK